MTPGVAFATLSLIQLQQSPTITILDGFERFQTLYRCFGRIQDHLLADGWVDCRSKSGERKDVEKSTDRGDVHSASSSDAGREQETKVLKDGLVASIQDVTVWYSKEEPILNNLTFEAETASITAIVGPVGCGKSTLLKLLLGEIPRLQGSVCTSFSTVAYCSQRPWITGTSIRGNIVGMENFDEKRYQRVVEAAALLPDFHSLVAGDKTQAGTRGIKLSGGQQARVVCHLLDWRIQADIHQGLARALYSMNNVMVMDDPLAGLDRATEKNVLEAVFGSSGLLRQSKASVIFSTSSGAFNEATCRNQTLIVVQLTIAITPTRSSCLTTTARSKNKELHQVLKVSMSASHLPKLTKTKY